LFPEAGRDIRSILAAAGVDPILLPRPMQALVLNLPTVPTRPLSDYVIGGAIGEVTS
jgi:hypothetical protein